MQHGCGCLSRPRRLPADAWHPLLPCRCTCMACTEFTPQSWTRPKSLCANQACVSLCLPSFKLRVFVLLFEPCLPDTTCAITKKALNKPSRVQVAVSDAVLCAKEQKLPSSSFVRRYKLCVSKDGQFGQVQSVQQAPSLHSACGVSA